MPPTALSPALVTVKIPPAEGAVSWSMTNVTEVTPPVLKLLKSAVVMAACKFCFVIVIYFGAEEESPVILRTAV